MATEVAAPQLNFWNYPFMQLLSRLSYRTKALFEYDYGHVRANQTTFIDDLPEEILIKIFQHLSQSTVARCERVCKRWLDSIRSAGAQLWKRADIHYVLKPHYYGNLNSGLVGPHEKLELYVQYLLQMEPRISTLSINLNLVDAKAFRAIEFLISSGFCKDLKKVDVRWHNEDNQHDWQWYDENEYDRSCYHFNEMLKLLHKQITHMKMQLNFGFESLKQLVKFRDLVHLDIVCVPYAALLMPWHIEKVLKNLTKLKVFRLKVIVNSLKFSNTVSLFNFASSSLQTLDLSYCHNLVISVLDLPNLEVFQARSMDVFHALKYNEDIPCLFDALCAGCPRLKEIKSVPVSPREAVAGLSAAKQKQLNICFCPRRHADS